MNDDLFKIIEKSEKDYDIQETLKKVFNKLTDYEISLSEEELNRILSLISKKMQDNNRNSEVKKIMAEIKPDEIILYIEKNIFKFIITKYYIEMVPYIYKNQLACEIKKVNMGNINISNESAIKSIKDMEGEFILVDENRNSLILNIQMPENIKIETISTEDKVIKLFVKRISGTVSGS